jgi:phospholipase/lecithinase/hemolysin
VAEARSVIQKLPKHMELLARLNFESCQTSSTQPGGNMRFSRFAVILARGSAFLFVALGAVALATAQTYPSFSKLVVFGDSLSDVDNVRDRMESNYLISYPGGDFNYSDGRFTNSSDTDPGSDQYVGVWHEQLARTFLGLPPATASLDGGFDYAWGGATTKDGTQDRTVFNNPEPFLGGDHTVTIDNMGRQLENFFHDHNVDASALYCLWGGANDFFDDPSAENVAAASTRIVGLIDRLVAAGARSFLVPNVPPLGGIPKYAGAPLRQTAANQASFDYRNRLNADLDAAEAAYAQQGIPVTIYRVDVWSLYIRLLINPGSYGFANITDPAQDRSVDPDTYAFWDEIHPTTAGHFRVAEEAARVLSNSVLPMARAENESARVAVGNDDRRAIAGLIITGNVPKKVIIRGIGPSLTQHGVPGVLADPVLTLFDANHNVIASNDDWQDSQANEIIMSGLAPMDAHESAIVAELLPGAYTAVLGGVNSSTGVGLAEVYDLEPSSDASFGNLSTRGFVGTGDNVLIGGLSIGSGDNPIVVVRAIGPTLLDAGIQDALADPILELYNADGMQVSANDNWKDGQPSAAMATLLDPLDDRESLIATTIAPGNYTAIVRGSGDTTGTGLIEAYLIQ